MRRKSENDMNKTLRQYQSLFTVATKSLVCSLKIGPNKITTKSYLKNFLLPIFNNIPGNY